MAAGNASFRYFVLGLLARQPMSGYDIRRLLGNLGWLLGNPSFGTIYPALHALLDDGLVTVQVVPHENRPARKIYTITEAGQKALDDRGAQLIPSGSSLKSFLMYLILADRSPHPELGTYLERRREMVTTRRLALEQMAGELDPQANPGQLMAIEYGMALASAEQAWLEAKLNELAVHPEAHPSEGTNEADAREPSRLSAVVGAGKPNEIT